MMAYHTIRIMNIWLGLQLQDIRRIAEELAVHPEIGPVVLVLWTAFSVAGAFFAAGKQAARCALEWHAHSEGRTRI